MKSILDELKKDKDGKYILPLSSPIKFGSETIKEFIISEPKARHIRHLPSTPTTDDMLKICAELAAQPDSIIDELSLKDVGRITEFIEVFS